MKLKISLSACPQGTQAKSVSTRRLTINGLSSGALRSCLTIHPAFELRAANLAPRRDLGRLAGSVTTKPLVLALLVDSSVSFLNESLFKGAVQFD